MKNAIQILHTAQDNDLNFLDKKFLLIDTSFLIDASKYRAEYTELISMLDAVDCELVSLEAVYYEFMRGGTKQSQASDFHAFFSTVVKGSVLPIDPIVAENVKILTKILIGRKGNISYVDALLLGMVMKYKGEVMLLTRDRTDVLTTLFPIVVNIKVETVDGNAMYSIYSFDSDSYQEYLKNLAKLTF